MVLDLHLERLIQSTVCATGSPAPLAGFAEEEEWIRSHYAVPQRHSSQLLNWATRAVELVKDAWTKLKSIIESPSPELTEPGTEPNRNHFRALGITIEDTIDHFGGQNRRCLSTGSRALSSHPHAPQAEPDTIHRGRGR